MSIIGLQLVTLSSEEIARCTDFAYQSAQSQQQIEFGSSDTKPRKITEIARDNLIGKMAEVAFAKFLESNFGISTVLDFNIYPRGTWDTDDFSLNGHPVDIKATRQGGRWLLIELSKLEFRKREGKLPEYFLFAVTGWIKDPKGVIEHEQPTNRVQLMGYAPLTQICNPNLIGTRTSNICENIPNTLFLPKGSLIPSTAMRLQADNCGRLASNLETNWTSLIETTSEN